ncbi:Na+/H+ antiporter subunit E [Pseudomonas sp. EA_105y_Pfl2_R69]|uniref:Na+/H+ antiporter subunit E n=1 Tax=Pseudomonas sp. EA_105y_Pfl2_R69 TaxID=3088683 RepID=UPI0030DCF354
MFLLHLSLSLVLAALAGHLHGWGALSAFALLYLLCKLAWPSVRLRQYARRVELGSRFIPWFIGQVALASLDVARLVLARQVAVEPAIVAVRLRSRNAKMVTLIGGLLTLTPGTLALDYRAADGTLFIHVLDARQQMEVESLVHNLESRLLHWLEPAATGERR